MILAKAPIPGTVKTRLIPALGAQGAATLAAAMLRRTVAIAIKAALGPVELCVAPCLDLHLWQELALPPQLQWSEQGEGDLGARLARAARRSLQGGEPVLLIGTDCPGLGAIQLRTAAAQLHQHEGALLPTLDGGYALLGLRAFHSAPFEAMPWSTAQVFPETCRRLAAIGWSWQLQPPLADIDVPEDLVHLDGELRDLALQWMRR